MRARIVEGSGIVGVEADVERALVVSDPGLGLDRAPECSRSARSRSPRSNRPSPIARPPRPSRRRPSISESRLLDVVRRHGRARSAIDSPSSIRSNVSRPGPKRPIRERRQRPVATATPNMKGEADLLRRQTVSLSAHARSPGLDDNPGCSGGYLRSGSRYTDFERREGLVPGEPHRAAGALSEAGHPPLRYGCAVMFEQLAELEKSHEELTTSLADPALLGDNGGLQERPPSGWRRSAAPVELYRQVPGGDATTRRDRRS